MAPRYGTLSVAVTADTRGMAQAIRGAATSAGQDAARGIGTEVNKGVSGIRGVLGAVGKAAGVALAGATVAAAGFAVESVKTAARVGAMDAALRAMAQANGLNEQAVLDQVQAVRRQGVEYQTAQNTVAGFIKNQLDLGQSTDLARVAQDLAVVSNSNSSEVLDKLIHGISTQNSMVLRNAGVTVNAGQAMDEYAKQLGKSRNELTPTERAQAVLNAVLRDGERVAGAYAAAMNEPGKVLTSFPRLLEWTQVAFGKMLLQGMGPAIISSYKLASAFTEAIQPGGKLAPVMAAIGDVAERIMTPITNLIDRIREWLDGLNAAQVQRFADGLRQWGPLLLAAVAGFTLLVAPQILGNLPFMGNAVSNIGLAFTKSMIPGVGGASNALGGLLGPLGLVAIGLGALVMLSPELRAAFGEVAGEVMGALREAFADVWAAIQPLLPVLRELALTLGEALAGGVRSLTPLITGLIDVFAQILIAVMPLIPKLVEFVVRVVEALLPTLPTLVDLGLKLAEAFLRLLEAVLPILPPLIEFAAQVIEALVPYLPVLIQALVILIDAFTRLLAPIMDVIGTRIAENLSFITPVLAPLTAAILFGVGAWQAYKAITGAIDFIQMAARVLTLENAERAGAIATNLWNAAKTAGSGIVTFFTTTTVGQTIATWANTAAGWAGTAAQWAWNAAKTAATWVIGLVTGLISGETLAKWADTAATWASNAAQWAWNAAKTAATVVGGFLLGILSGETLAKWADTIATWAANAAQWAWNAAKWAGAAAMGVLTGLISGQTIVTVADTIARWASTVATGAWTVAQWLLNAAFWACPLTWIIAGIILVIGIIILIATKTDWFQRLWNGAWTAIRNAANWCATQITNAWNWLKAQWDRIWGGIKRAWDWVWDNIISKVAGALANVKNGIRDAWNWVQETWQNIWNAIKRFWHGFWDNTIGRASRTLAEIGQKISAAWTWVKQTTADIWNGISGFFRNKWEGLKNTARSATEWIKTKVSDAWGSIRDTSRRIWENMVSIIGRTWQGLKKAVGSPIWWVANHIIKPLINGINFLTSKIGLGKIGTDWIGKIPHFARGGKVPGSGTGDTTPILAAPGEWVLTRAQAARIGYDTLRRLPRYQEGGEVGPQARLPGIVERALPAVKGIGRSAWDKAWGFTKEVTRIQDIAQLGKEVLDEVSGMLRRAAAEAFKALTAPLKKAAEPWLKHPKLFPEQWGGKTITTIIDKAVEFIDSKAVDDFAGGAGVDELAQEVMKRFPGLRITSRKRPGDPGYHGKDMARDLAGPVKLMHDAGRWMSKEMASQLLEGIMNPTLSVKNGNKVPNSFWGAGTWAGHADHIHMAAEGGGGKGTAVPRPVEGWRGMVTQIAKMHGIPETVNAWLRQIASESGGDPNIVQKVRDVNWPHNKARGLLQVIPTTFAAQRGNPFGGNIFDPRANIWAAMNYAKKGRKLGQIGRGHGYARGGIISEPVIGFGERSGEMYTIAERAPEAVTPLSGRSAIEISPPQAGGGITVNVYPREHQDERAIAAAVSRELAWARAGGGAG